MTLFDTHIDTAANPSTIVRNMKTNVVTSYNLWARKLDHLSGPYTLELHKEITKAAGTDTRWAGISPLPKGYKIVKS